LVPIDGSDAALRAVALSLTLAKLTAADLLFFHAADPAGGGADEIFARARAEAADANVDAACAYGQGPPVGAICDLLSAQRIDAIVMGARGTNRSPRFLGSTARGVLRRAVVPVFVLPAPAALPDRLFRAIEVGFDDSPAAAAALALVLDLATPSITRLIVARCVDLQAEQRVWSMTHEPRPMPLPNTRDANLAALAAAAERARRRGIEAEPILLAGSPAVRIVEMSRLHAVDLIALGACAPASSAIATDLAQAVICAALVPVVIVPAGEETARRR
jgi:nucleotide-binding universal stress UspA family protein